MAKQWAQAIWKTVKQINWLTLAFWIIFVLSLWAVLSWGFGWIGLLDFQVSQQVADATLALSYSYLAGCMFYFLTSLFPTYIKKRREIKYIVKEIKEIGTKLHSALEIFRVNNLNMIVNLDDKEVCKKLLLSKNWEDSFGELKPGRNTYFKWFYGEVQEIMMIAVNIVAKYKEVLSEKQIELLDKINDKSFLEFLNICAPAKGLSDYAKEAAADYYIRMIENYNELYLTFRKHVR